LFAGPQLRWLDGSLESKDNMHSRMIQPRNLSIERITAAFTRRLKAIPHSVAWNLYSGEGTANFNRLKSFRNKHLDDRCFILGNGPSLRNMDLKPLRDEVTFGSNRVYLLFENLGFETTYYVSTNDLVIEQCSDEIKNITSPKFINWRMRHLFSESENIAFIREVYRSQFSFDITKNFWGGGTVTYAMMQIAYFMGFQKVILLGVDHSFTTKGTPHKIVVAQDEDQDHFDPNYFSKGFRWQLPDLVTSEFAYKLAREAYEKDGREILDATVDGKLTVFPKVDYLKVLQKSG